MDESNNNNDGRILKDNNNGDDGTTSYSTSSTSGDDADGDDNGSTNSSDDALCDILGLPSLSGMVMMADEDEDGESEDLRGELMGLTKSEPSRRTMVSRRIELPFTRGVSRKYHPSEDCFAYEIQNVLSPNECSRLIEVAANSNSKASQSQSKSSFRYITHAVHTAPDGETKFEVKLERPNPHKLAVFRHEAWVATLWDRIKPFLFERDDHRNSRNSKSDATTTPTRTNWQNVEIAENENKNKNGSSTDGSCSMRLAEALELFIRRESLSASPIAGLNPRLRVLKYDASDKDEFQGHFDATTEIHSSLLGQTSYMTVLVYLNDGDGGDFEGGETEFLSQERKEQQQTLPLGSAFPNFEKDEAKSGMVSVDSHREKSSNNIKMVTITPKAGSVVLFEHDLFHRGRPLLWGTKYVLRTDIMFTNPPSCDVGVKTETETIHELEPQTSRGGKTEIPNKEEATVLHLTVEDILSRIEEEQNRLTTNPNQIHISLLLRNALAEGLGIGNDLKDTTIQCLCSPGRFALNLMLREHMIPVVAGASQQQQEQVGSYYHHQRAIDVFLDVSFAALLDQPR